MEHQPATTSRNLKRDVGSGLGKAIRRTSNTTPPSIKRMGVDHGLSPVILLGSRPNRSALTITEPTRCRHSLGMGFPYLVHVLTLCTYRR